MACSTEEDPATIPTAVQFGFFRLGSTQVFPDMKIVTGVLIVFLASGTAAAPCDTMALGKLLANGDARTCRGVSGYNPMSMTLPTNAQFGAMCSSDACTKAIDAVKQAAPNECTIGPFRLYTDILDPLSQRCGAALGSPSVDGSISGPGSATGKTVGSSSVGGSISGPSSTTSNTVGSDMSGLVNKTPAINTPTTHPTSSRAVDAPTLSTCTVITVLAMLVVATL